MAILLSKGIDCIAQCMSSKQDDREWLTRPRMEDRQARACLAQAGLVEGARQPQAPQGDRGGRAPAQPPEAGARCVSKGGHAAVQPQVADEAGELVLQRGQPSISGRERQLEKLAPPARMSPQKGGPAARGTTAAAWSRPALAVSARAAIP